MRYILGQRTEGSTFQSSGFGLKGHFRQVGSEKLIVFINIVQKSISQTLKTSKDILIN